MAGMVIYYPYMIEKIEPVTADFPKDIREKFEMILGMLEKAKIPIIVHACVHAVLDLWFIWIIAAYSCYLRKKNAVYPLESFAAPTDDGNNQENSTDQDPEATPSRTSRLVGYTPESLQPEKTEVGLRAIPTSKKSRKKFELWLADDLENQQVK